MAMDLPIYGKISLRWRVRSLSSRGESTTDQNCSQGMIWCRTGRSSGLSQYSLVWGAISVVIGEVGTDIHCGACGELRSKVLMPCFLLWVSIGPMLWFPAGASLALAWSAWEFWVSGSLHCSQLDIMSQMPNGWKWRDPWISTQLATDTNILNFSADLPRIHKLANGTVLSHFRISVLERQMKWLHKYRNFHVFSCTYTSKSTV